jgi:HSP20 family protein
MATIVRRWDPWQQLARLQQNFDDVFGQVQTRQEGGGSGGPNWLPRVDISRTGDNIVFKLDLPGIRPDQVEIEVRDRTLIVSGTREEERETDHEGYLTRERSFGTFTRSFTLPDGIEEDRIGARFDNGVLSILVPLPQETKPRRIEIATGGGSSSRPEDVDVTTASSGQSAERLGDGV